jgi:4-carboxymuconolactone decarboxylase
MLTQATFVGFAITAQPEAAKAFYADVLGLTLLEETDFALVFDAHGAPLRLQKLDETPPPAATTIGWQVTDIDGEVRNLTVRGVAFERFGGLDQDDFGVWTTPAGARVAWFRDPDGNRLSLMEAAPIEIVTTESVAVETAPLESAAMESTALESVSSEIAPVDSEPAPEQSAYERGAALRRKVLGDAYVDEAEAAKTAFDDDFQKFVIEGAWGSVWSRPGLTLRERSLLTLTLLAALGQHDAFAVHLRATQNTGASESDVREALLHVAAYAGAPAADSAIKVAKATLAAMKES